MRRVVGVVLIAVLAVSACTKAEEPQASPSSSTSSTELNVAEGTYGWSAYGVTATLTPGPEAWSLEIANDSGRKLGAPGVYALASDDGHEVDAKVQGSRPLADGASATLEVTWPADFDRKNVGMVMLLMGEDLYGGFEKGR